MDITKKQGFFKSAKYVPQEVDTGWYGRFKRTYHPHHNRKFKCEKFICENLVSGEKTTGIMFSTGKFKIGDDVWRLSNSADFPEYYYETYRTKTEAEQIYRIYPAPDNNPKFFLELTEEEEDEMQKKFEEISERKTAYKDGEGGLHEIS